MTTDAVYPPATGCASIRSPAGTSITRQRPTRSSRGDAAVDLVFAYIDPGSGSLLIQALIAGLVAIPIFFRNQIGRAVRAIRGPRDDASAPVQRDEASRAD